MVCTVILKAERNRIVRELFAALADGNSYRPWSNLHALFGLLWGLPIPFFSLTIDLMARGQAYTIATIMECFRLHPIHLLFLFHPPAFLILFGLFDEKATPGLLARSAATPAQLLRQANGFQVPLHIGAREFLLEASRPPKKP